MSLFRIISLIIFLQCITCGLFAQTKKPQATDNILLVTKDSLKDIVLKDTTGHKKHIPRIATRRSAVLPGWGQAYNGEHWKIPIVYGALAIPTYTFFYNNSYYKKTKFAYEARFKQSVNPSDTTDIHNIDPQLKNLDLYSLQSYRNAFRRDRDYSILWFAILWGVNVIDATVFAHLKDFDVSSDLSMHIEPTFNSSSKTPGINVALNFKTPKHTLSSVTK